MMNILPSSLPQGPVGHGHEGRGQEHGLGGEVAGQGHQLHGAAEDLRRHGQVRAAVRGP